MAVHDANGPITNGHDGELTEAQAAVYDRQLRVWGVETQKRINNAKVLIVGCSGLGAEVAKNIALAGVGHLAIMDETPVSAAAPGNFLITADADPNLTVAQASAATLQDMNPLVRVKVIPGNIDEGLLNLVAGFSVLLVTRQPLRQLRAVEEACEEKGVGFFTAASRGTTGFTFANLHEHSFTVTVLQGDSNLTHEETINFCSFERALSDPWGGLPPRQKFHPLIYTLRACYQFEKGNGRTPTASDLEAVHALGRQLIVDDGYRTQTVHNLPEDDLAEFVCGEEELPPVNAILGGVLANEILKAISRRDAPLNNFLFFSLRNGSGTVEKLG